MKKLFFTIVGVFSLFPALNIKALDTQHIIDNLTNMVQTISGLPPIVEKNLEELKKLRSFAQCALIPEAKRKADPNIKVGLKDAATQKITAIVECNKLNGPLGALTSFLTVIRDQIVGTKVQPGLLINVLNIVEIAGGNVKDVNNVVDIIQSVLKTAIDILSKLETTAKPS